MYLVNNPVERKSICYTIGDAITAARNRFFKDNGYRCSKNNKAVNEFYRGASKTGTEITRRPQ